jgi:uncharacterized protein YjgD (DUF1641 family)
MTKSLRDAQVEKELSLLNKIIEQQTLLKSTLDSLEKLSINHELPPAACADIALVVDRLHNFLGKPDAR